MPRPRFAAALLVLFVPLATRAADPFRYTEGSHGQAALKYMNGLPVLTVAGSPEEIGEQIGVLTATPARRLVDYPKEMLQTFHVPWAWPYFIWKSRALAPQFPADHARELDALAKHAGLNRDLVLAANTMPDLMKLWGCSALIVEAPRSATHAPLFGRNLDYFTVGYLQDYSLVTVYRPRGKHAFVSVGFPGMIGCLSGMNDAGLVLATLEVHSSRDGSPSLDPKGIPYTLGLRRVLEECATVAEAEKLLRSMPRTTLNNLAICDPKGGAVFEITSRNVVVRRPEDSLCACTNHFCTKALATSRKCRRFDALMTSRALPRIDLADLAKKLDAANQGPLTLQTMIFEPAALKLHLAIGKTPTSALPMKPLDLTPFLAKPPTSKPAAP